MTRKRQKESERPSIFFIVALAAGLALLFWFFAQTLRHPTRQSPSIIWPSFRHLDCHLRGINIA